MLTGQIPYYHLECMQTLFRIERGEPPPIPDSLSKDAWDFIMQCIQVNPDTCPTAAKLLQHPFVKRPLPTPSGSTSFHLGQELFHFPLLSTTIVGHMQCHHLQLLSRTFACQIRSSCYKLSKFYCFWYKSIILCFKLR